MINLPTNLKRQLFSIYQQYQNTITPSEILDERDYIKKTINFFRTLNPIKTQTYTISTRSIKTDNKLFAYLQTPRTIFKNPQKEEFGDILYVTKFLKNNVLDYRVASLIQAKFTKGNAKKWSIDSGQFHYMLYFPMFQLGSKTKIICPKFFNLKPKTKTWSNYVFVNQHDDPVYNSTNLIMELNKSTTLGQKSFTYNPLINRNTRLFYSKLFKGAYGEEIYPYSNIDIFYLIDKLYKYFGWIPDPPSDFCNLDSFEDDEEGGFGLVEFKINMKEQFQEFK